MSVWVINALGSVAVAGVAFVVMVAMALAAVDSASDAGSLVEAEEASP